jgi:hypothetical protein
MTISPSRVSGSRELLEALVDVRGEAEREDVAAQMAGGRDLVDVLAAGAAGCQEGFGQRAFGDVRADIANVRIADIRIAKARIRKLGGSGALAPPAACRPAPAGSRPHAAASGRATRGRRRDRR